MPTQVRPFTVLLLATWLSFLPAMAAQGIDYADRANWTLRPADSQTPHPVDVFYVYPTMVADREHPLMDWSQPGVRIKTERFATAQLVGFAAFANLFAPFVRQLEFGRALAELSSAAPGSPTGEPAQDSAMLTGVLDTVDAFAFYRQHLGGGRPVILLGHSQGAFDLLELLARRSDLCAGTGLVAAYLPGIPLDPGAVQRRFGSRIILAKGQNDCGVIVNWNTQSPTASNPMFTRPAGACINPLNWRTDNTPAAKTENLGAMFYDYKDNTSRTWTHFCGAAIDLAAGALIVNPPPGNWDMHGRMGQGVYHVNDIFFYYENIVRNARDRFASWQLTHANPKQP